MTKQLGPESVPRPSVAKQALCQAAAAAVVVVVVVVVMMVVVVVGRDGGGGDNRGRGYGETHR